MKSSQRRAAEKTVTNLGAVLDFMRLLWRLDHALNRTSKRMKPTLGVTAPQRLVLRIVGRFPDLPAGELALLLHLHPSTLTGVLKRLESARLLARRADPRDRRRSLLRLTVKGKQLDVLSAASVEAAVKQALETIPAAPLSSARAVLETVTATLEANLEAPRQRRKRSRPQRKAGAAVVL